MSATFLLLILLGVGRSMAGRRLVPTGDTELTETITSPLDQVDATEKGTRTSPDELSRFRWVALRSALAETAGQTLSQGSVPAVAI